ncbi:hypothetical protein [Albidovulum sp.]|uniref:rolling circle replication-associated protein n=1 Tax=Albidovulum sp. TaxID=1872424 RepID=UPI0039B8D970
MCLAPVSLPLVGFVECRKCWQCKRNRVDDLVGRCIAESHMATETLAVTLTYGGGDVPEAAILMYSDFQRFMKRLRKSGFKVRYIVAGEFGSAKGRAHWHCILFFYGKAPVAAVDPDQRQPDEVFYPRFEDDAAGRVAWSYWPHGFSWVEKPSYKAFRYVCKYVLKSEEQEISVGHLAMSKKPPLGDGWFRQLAEQYVEQGLAPRDLAYSFRDVFKPTGERRKFIIQGVTRDNFLAHYLATWRERRRDSPPESDVVIEYEDRQVKWSKAEAWRREENAIRAKAAPSWQPNLPRYIKVVAPVGMVHTVCKDEIGEYWAVVNDGVYKWRRKLESRAAIRSALRSAVSRENVTVNRNTSKSVNTSLPLS